MRHHCTPPRVTCEESCAKSHLRRVTCEESHGKKHVRRVTCHQESVVKSHMRRVQENALGP
eukprot:234819-Rhodomonas_salina.1